MENEPEVPVTQNEPVVEIPEIKEVALSAEEIADLRHKAEVSSQNFERAKKAEQEAKELRESLALLDTAPSIMDEEKVRTIEGELAEVKSKLARTEVIEQYPVLKETWSDFESFRNSEDNKGMSIKTAAKAFLTEKGLLDPVRKGLEKPTGGDRAPISSGMTSDEAKKLRETDYKKYMDLLKKGLINVA